MSTSSSNGLPAELSADLVAGQIQSLERHWLGRLALLSPLLALLLAPVLSHSLKFLLLLQPLPAWQWSIVTSPLTLLCGAGILGCLCGHWALVCISRRLSAPAFPAAIAGSIAILVAAQAVVLIPKVDWFLREWAYVRGSRFELQRGIINWQQSGRTAVATSSARVGILATGSSQVQHGVIPAVLEQELPTADLELRALPRLIPCQYLLVERAGMFPPADFVVLYLSEFDFYCYETIPTDRIRWASTLPFVTDTLSVLSPQMIVANRTEIADSAFAAICPLWERRDRFRRAIWNYWWRTDPYEEAPPPAQDLAAYADAVPQTQPPALTEYNFSTFDRYCQLVAQKGTTIVVLEGECRPDRMALMFPGSREVTRQRIGAILASLPGRHFYFSTADGPVFSAADFKDPTHLSDAAAHRLSHWLAAELKAILDSPRDHSH